MEIEARGAPAHTRTLVVAIAQEDDAHLRADGTILDLRKRGLVPMAADLQTAGVIHDMHVHARIATTPPRIAAIRAEQPGVAFEPTPATGGECCRDPVDRIAALVDTPLDTAAPSRLGAAIGGPRGCSHVLTLAQLLVSTARRAIDLERARFADAARPAGQRLFHRSLSVDGLADGGTVHLALQMADVHFTPVRPANGGDPLDRLAERREIRAHAELELGTLKLRTLRAAERTGDRDTFYGEWQDRSEAFADLTGISALGGMAARLFERLGDRDEDRPLLDALLHLAPTVIQCIPATVERWHGSAADGGPGRMANGGMTDSCYMWRRGGALLGPPKRTA